MIPELDVVAGLPMAFVVFDENLDVVTASREAFSLLNLRLHPDRRDECMKELAQAVSNRPGLIPEIGASTLRMRHVGSCDTIRWTGDARTWDIRVFPLSVREELYFGVHFADITARLELERTGEIARNYLEVILDSLPVGITVMDTSMRVTSINTAQQNIHRRLGMDKALLQVVGMQAADLFDDEQQPGWDIVKRKVLADAETLSCRMSRRTPDGNELVLSVGFAPLRDEHGNIVGAVRICDDITRQVELEKEARETELLSARLETIRQVSVTLNHEINNALAVIAADIEMIARFNGAAGGNCGDMLEQMRVQSDRIADVVRRFTGLEEIRTVEYLDGSGEQMIDLKSPPGE